MPLDAHFLEPGIDEQNGDLFADRRLRQSKEI